MKQVNEIMVSVICMAYNHEKYIRDALEGFVSQKTSFAFEVIVHDDASTDGTARIIQEYKEKYPDIIIPIIQKENIGKAYSRYYDYILPLAKGKYIAICEGDDYWTDCEKLQKQFDFLEVHVDYSLVSHESLKYYMREKTYTRFSEVDYSIPINRELSPSQIILNHNYFHTSSMFFRKDYFYKNNEFLRTHSIYDYVHKMLLVTEGKVYVIPQVMSVYRRESDGAWSSRTNEDHAFLVNHIEKGIKIMHDINEYREYRYEKEFQKGILSREFWLEEELHNYSVLKKPPYLEIYKELPLQSKIRIFIEMYFPFLYNPIKKIKHIISKSKRDE